MRWLVIVVLLAGCGAPEPPGPETSTMTITDPADLSNAMGQHVHDYWGGADRLVVLDASHPGGLEQGAGPGLSGGGEVMTFLPDSGDVVPQGTASVEVTITWQDAPGDQYSGPHLWVQTAQDAEAWDAGPVTSGEAVVVASTNERNDLPHQLLSAWAFSLHMGPSDAGFLRFKGSVTIHVEVVRGLGLPLFPAHPDHWGDATEFQLLDVAGSIAYVEDPVDHGCNGLACPTVHVPERIVPPGASEIHATLTSTGVPMGLSYHGPESRDFHVAAATGVQGDAQTFVIPVDGYTDGPYALQSQWAFLPFLDAPYAAGAADYTLVVSVMRA